ncbi:glycosyltransferase family 2 protein [Winogradskyella sp.]|nr:glycosyltransferase family 2 protein [Winogradskyella sp.]MDA8874524.1 glycosyltransferase family 2 protein [Winogradskyella sp.]
MPKVSVIIPTYNNPKQLERSINSVLGQTYKDIEVIIVNDGSTVDYADLRSQFSNNKNILFFDKDNEGPGLARQFGLNKSTGKYINYLDAGDELLPKKIEKQVAILNSNTNIILTYGLSMIEGNSKVLHRPKMNRSEFEDVLKIAVATRKWHTSSPLWRYKKKENYWSNYFNGEDVYHDFTVAIENREDAHFLDEILVNLTYDNPDGGLSNASDLEKNHLRFVKDTVDLNLYILEKLKSAKLLKFKQYREGLSERIYHASMRVYLTGYKEESLFLLKTAKKTTKSTIKYIEILILYIVIMAPLKRKRPIFQFLYKVRRRILSSNIHQYRYI